MNTKLRVLSTLGALAIVVGACTGGATKSPSSTGTTPSAGATAGASGGATGALKGELTIWHSYGSGAGTEATALKTVTDKIQAANPDLKLTIQDVKFDDLFKKFELEAASGGGPDLFIAPNDSLGKEARAGLFLDVTSKLEGKLGNMSEVAVEGSKVDGKLYMVPESLKAVAAYYDKSKVTTPPATTDELLAGIKSGSIKAGFLRGSYHAFGFWAAFGGKLMDDKGKCVADTTGVGDAYNYFKETAAAGATWYEKYDDLAADFKSGKINYIVDGPWASGGYKEALKDNLAVAPMPAGPKGPSQPLTGVDGWYINTNAKDPDLAVNFALEMIKPENEQVFVDVAGHIPADTTLTIADPLTLKFAEAVKTGFPRPQNTQLDNFWGNFDNALTLVMTKGEDGLKAATDACVAMNAANKIQ
ncbi:MAG TPA: extracellular solute-binding protein [Candidatus Limnocylindrales bacterium]|nr:extracellular solute-binding protein [Candidatus Limnocylindrales bacterium]